MNVAYSASPVAYRDTVIVPVGSPDCGAMALDGKSGQVAWRSPPYPVTSQDSQGFQATPVVVPLAESNQIVFMSPTEVIGIDAASGQSKWRYPHQNDWQYNCVTPLVVGHGLVYVTSHSGAGSRVLSLTEEGEATVVLQLWHNPGIGLYHNNGVFVGDHVYGCHGALLYAQVARTGEVTWRRRGLVEATMVHARVPARGDQSDHGSDGHRFGERESTDASDGGRFILLDEKGVLALAKASTTEMTMLARFQLFTEDEGVCWTPPTLVGNRLYLRNRQRVVALQLP